MTRLLKYLTVDAYTRRIAGALFLNPVAGSSSDFIMPLLTIPTLSRAFTTVATLKL